MRKSGTEPKVRIMAESLDKKLIIKCIKLIKGLLDKLKPRSKILIIAGSIQAEFKLILRQSRH